MGHWLKNNLKHIRLVLAHCHDKTFDRAILVGQPHLLQQHASLSSNNAPWMTLDVASVTFVTPDPTDSFFDLIQIKGDANGIGSLDQFGKNSVKSGAYITFDIGSKCPDRPRKQEVSHDRDVCIHRQPRSGLPDPG